MVEESTPLGVTATEGSPEAARDSIEALKDQLEARIDGAEPVIPMAEKATLTASEKMGEVMRALEKDRLTKGAYSITIEGGTVATPDPDRDMVVLREPIYAKRGADSQQMVFFAATRGGFIKIEDPNSELYGLTKGVEAAAQNGDQRAKEGYPTRRMERDNNTGQAADYGLPRTYTENPGQYRDVNVTIPDRRGVPIRLRAVPVTDVADMELVAQALDSSIEKVQAPHISRSTAAETTASFGQAMLNAINPPEAPPTPPATPVNP